MQSAGEPHL